MLIIGLGLLLLVVFVAFAESARNGRAGARALALLEAGLLVPLAAFGVLAAWALMTLGCDETCDDAATQWWHSRDAWQWWGQLGTALLGAVAVAEAFAATWRERYRRASVLMVLAAAAFGAWAAFLAPMGDELGI